MTHPSEEKQTQSPDANGNEVDERTRLPNVLSDDEQPAVCDLPRKGVAKPVANVAKGTNRLPDVLIED